MKYYGVSQYCHGHEYRYVFDEETLSKNIYDGEPVPDNDFIDCFFPIGGSNSSATEIQLLEGDDDIRSFLTSTGYGPDLEDPMLVDIGEYLLTVSGDDKSCTDQFIQKFGLNYQDLEQFDDEFNHKENVKKMVEFLKSCGYTGMDLDNPFYGENSNMRYSELCDLCEERGMQI